jgi:hypothetical protein
VSGATKRNPRNSAENFPYNPSKPYAEDLEQKKNGEAKTEGLPVFVVMN